MTERKQKYRERSIKYDEKETPEERLDRLAALMALGRSEVDLKRLREENAQLRYQLKRSQEAFHNARLDLVGERARNHATHD